MSENLVTSIYGCHRCRSKQGQLHHHGCSDRSRFVDISAYDRGWEDARCKGLESVAEEDPAYKAGFHNGVVAREEASNVSWHDYYGD